ncbi:hypothetical protein FB479_113178 [Brevibacillus sp. AG162]|uniref:DUF4760 domain-containing protein n=1 Tax=Brevibacillus sp. AG162 TaxID=2572910 RepID=UPI00115398C7|nr:hypothetical protein [Brevibacillus sp. AG162]TQK45788.1 hypothetical protein FB479_113178 [Brevibacillus sp. AG162]
MIQFETAFFMLYLLCCIAFVFLYISLYVNRHFSFKKIEFTQKFIDSNRAMTAEIDKILFNIELVIHTYESGNFYGNENHEQKLMDELHDYATQLFSILKYFNNIASGVDKNIFDENVVRVNYEHDMRACYKRLRLARRGRDYNDETFLPLEFLLKKWDSKNPAKLKWKVGI